MAVTKPCSCCMSRVRGDCRMSLYKGKALNFNSLGVILRLYFATDASLRVVRIQCLGVRNKRGRNTVLKCNKVAKTVLALLSVFSYHFTSELQRKISTEQAKSLPGNLIDKGILVMLPAQEGPVPEGISHLGVSSSHHKSSQQTARAHSGCRPACFMCHDLM